MTEQPAVPLDDFKPRELEILTLMAEGLSNKEIAARLFITTETVRWYNKHIYSKLGTSRRTEAVALARRMGLIGTDAATPTRQHRLPTAHGPFIGREDDLTALADLLARPEVRLLSIVAAGGMGKSRLSLALGHRIAPRYDRGAVFIDLTPVRNAADIAAAALASLGISGQDLQDPRQSLLDYCREKNLLLILDNWEHLLDGVSLLTDILDTAPDVKLITTSRERLNLRVETVYHLQPIIQHGQTLFLELAAMMRPAISLTEADGRDVKRIVELVGGMPLALTLAATWVDMLSIREIAEEIEQSLDFLSSELADMPERQRSIRAVIDPTWQRLSDAEQHAFMWVSVFRGGFTREMFQKVTGASLRVLQKLLSRSLVMPVHYDLHPLLRQYAREKLRASGTFAQAKAAHLAACLADAQENSAAMHNRRYLEALDALDAQQDNYRAALDWALAGAAAEDGARLAVALCPFWEIRTQVYEADHYLTLALTAMLPDPLRARVLCWRSLFKYRLGMIDASQEDAQQALTLAEALQDQEVIVRSLVYLAKLHPEPLQLLERALRESEAIGHQLLIAMSLNSLAIDQRDHALMYFERAQAIFEALGDLRGVSVTVYNIGLEHELRGQLVLAREHYERSLQLKRQIGDQAGVARRLSVLAFYHLMNEEVEQASAYLLESRLILEEVGDRQRWSYTVMVEGMVAFIQTHFQQAQATLEKGLSVAQELHQHLRLCDYYNFLGLVHLRQNQPRPARAYFVRCFEAATLAHQPYGYWLSLMGHAQYLWATGHAALSVPMTAVVDRFRSYGNAFDLRYLFDPHVYQVKQQIGEAAWTAAQADAAHMTLEQAFAEAAKGL